ncbi:MAG: DUF3800 domain-containing protein [Clostridia bacterium]|nr:DUF3800 domain-containing protein [Clostridia bacterium]
MEILSIFVDESGDFGPYEKHAPFYLFTLVFHDQNQSINEQVTRLEAQITEMNLSKTHCFHTGPIIRREEEYLYLDVSQRRRYLNRILTFAKSCGIVYQTFVVDKKQITDTVDLTAALAKQLSRFVIEHLPFFQYYDQVIVYYDNGQIELSKILASVFSTLLTNVSFRRVFPAEYRLFQVADFLCTMELISLKLDDNMLSKSEMQFFGSIRDLKKNYIKQVQRFKFK